MDESEIPIDIHTNKLLDWLISRRHVPRDWHKKVILVREKINEAIKDMPENEEITALLSGSYITYYHCLKLIEIFKKTESNTKNLFGQYSSKRIKDWMDIIKLYERDNIYLGEVASLLQQNVNFEVPGLKKQLNKIISLKNDYDKKESNYDKLAESAMKDYNASCKALGINGINVKQELIKKAAEFPKMCEDVVVIIKSLKTAVNFYEKVVDSLLNSKKSTLEILQYIIEYGNTTVYQWKYKKVPASVTLTNFLNIEEEREEESENNDVIDFGIEDEMINYNDIDIDIDIDWGISTVDSEPVKNAKDKAVAVGEEAYTVLGHLDTRNILINNILELETFLKVRMYEMKSDMDNLSLTLLPETLQTFDIKSLDQMLEAVQLVLNSLINPIALNYLNIITNQKYVDQLTLKLKQKLDSHKKMLASKDWVKHQRGEAIREAELLKPKIDLVIQKSKELQELIEEDISRRYKGRPVNLIAGANLL